MKILILLSMIVITNIASAKALTKNDKIEIMHELNIMYFKGVISFESMKTYAVIYDLDVDTQMSHEALDVLKEIYTVEQKR